MRMGCRSAVGIIIVWLLASCETPPPSYVVQTPTLRLIAEKGTLSPSGESVFVVAELSEADAGTSSRTLYVQAAGAQSLALPGPSHCAPAPPLNPGAADAGAGDAGAVDAGAPGTALADGGVVLAQGAADLVIPSIALRRNAQLNGYETGFLVTAGAGLEDVLVIAAVYRSVDPVSCVLPSAPLDAFAVLRLTRVRPVEVDAGADAGMADAGATDGGARDGGTDAGMTDAGISDAGTTDAGVSDAGTSDAGTNDAGSTDAGSSDGGDAG